MISIKKVSPIIGLASWLLTSAAAAGPMDQAFKLHERLTGVKPTDGVLTQMTALISGGQAKDAAKIAIQNPNFYDLVLPQFAAPFSNVQSSARVPLNDTTATIIGLIRDDVPFNQVLTGDSVYIGDPQVVANNPYTPVPARALAHFNALTGTGRSLRDALVPRRQTEFSPNIPAAGILTTQGWGQAYISAGTNRRIYMGVMRHFWCSEMEELHDTSVPALRIRRDVDRAPSKEPEVFLSKCIGCHNVMDPGIGGAAYFDYTDAGGITYSPGRVVAKVNRNNTTYPEGFVTTDDSWMFLGELSASQSFKKFGWRGAKSGNGLTSFATALSQSRGFSECMVKKVFSKLCLRSPSTVELQAEADQFEANQTFNLKDTFVSVATRCMD